MKFYEVTWSLSMSAAATAATPYIVCGADCGGSSSSMSLPKLWSAFEVG
jgi:hypothetical protein